MNAQALELLAAGLAAGGIVTFFMGVAAIGRRQNLDERMLRHAGLDRWTVAPRAASEGAGSDQLAGDINRRLSRSALGAAVQLRLVRAGLTIAPSQFFVYVVGAACLGMLLGFLLARAGGQGAQLLLALALGLVGAAIPFLVLTTREKQRRGAFERQLPQVIDSMAGTLQAGSTLPQAMEVIAREMPAPVSVEFQRVLSETELGLPLTDALANLHARVRSVDMVLVTSAISIQQRVGGDLATVFRGIANTVRERLRVRSEIKVLTAQGRYSAYIITALPILMFGFLWVVHYSYISQLLLPGITRVLLVGGVFGIVLGYISMQRIVNIEV